MNRLRSIHSLLAAAILLAAVSCKREQVVQYKIPDQKISTLNAPKNNLKSDQEFISILYPDLFGVPMPTAVLNDVTNASQSFGDKAVITDLLFRNYLKQSGLDIPDSASMRADPDAFVKAAYRKLFVRDPNEQEIWYVGKLIRENPDLSPQAIYYAMVMSNEYRYY